MNSLRYLLTALIILSFGVSNAQIKNSKNFYYQYCPMTNGGKGANWLSKENANKSPYYGSQMLTCGSTVETIK
jgi:Protein of unknown function (DUF3347).